MNLLDDMPKRSNSGGGDRTPAAKISVKVADPSTSVKVDGKMVTITGVLLSSVDGMKAGEEYTFTARDKKADALVKHVTGDDKLGKHLKPNVVLTLENVWSDKSFQWVTVLGRELARDGIKQEAAWPNQVVQMREHKKQGSSDTWTSAKVYKTNESIGLVGPGAEQSSEWAKQVVEALGADQENHDEFTASLLERARGYDDLDRFQQMGVAYDAQFLSEDVAYAAQGFDMVVRVIQLNQDLDQDDSYGTANIFGGMEKVDDGEGNETRYARDFAGAVSNTLGVDYADIVSKGVVDAMAHLAKEEDGKVTYGNPYTDTLVKFVSFLQSDNAKNPEIGSQIMVEGIPVTRMQVGKLAQDSKPGQNFDAAAMPMVGNYKQYPAVVADLGMKSHIDKQTDNPTGEYYLNKVRVVYGNDYEGRPARDAYKTPLLPTNNTACVDGLNDILATKSKEFISYLAGKSNDNQNDNQNDNDQQEHEQSNAPGM